MKLNAQFYQKPTKFSFTPPDLKDNLSKANKITFYTTGFEPSLSKKKKKCNRISVTKC
jgi:hypothetical protein